MPGAQTETGRDGVSQVAQWQRAHLPTHRTWVQSLGGTPEEDLLKEEMETFFSILAWKIPWTEEPGRL